MSAVTDLSAALTRALNLDPNEVTSIVYSHDAGEPFATVTATFIIQDPGELTAIEHKFILVPVAASAPVDVPTFAGEG